MEEHLYKEIYRYLGYRGMTPDEQTDALVAECLAQARKEMQPLSAVRRLDVRHTGEDRLLIGDMDIHSHGLSRNMQGCEKAYMLAVTIGHGIDTLIRRAEVTSMMKAAVMQSVGAALAEELCDSVNEEIRIAAEKEGYHCKPRFSPGYGDLSLGLQKDFERILNMRTNLGITLTDTLLMVPSKSVTAFVGLYRGAQECSSGGCSECNLYEDCTFRDEV